MLYALLFISERGDIDMDFLSKLEWLMKRDGLNRSTLAQKSGVPYTTIVGLFERGAENARLSTLNRLCACFNVSLDYLALEQYEKPEDFMPNGNTATVVCENGEEVEIVSLFRLLNKEGQRLVLSTIRTFAGNPDMQKEEQKASAI